jgi:PAS domain S-box-containing protein
MAEALAECRRRIAELESSKAQLEQAKETAERNAELLQHLLGALEDVVWAASADGTESLYINEAAERLYGRPRAAFLEDPDLWEKVIHPEDRERAGNVAEGLLEEQGVEIDYRIVRPDGEVRWVRDRKYVVYDQDGRPLRVVGIASDITDQKETQEALRESEEKARRLSEAAFEGIVIHEQGKVLEVNQVFAKMLGYEPSELIGRDGLALLTPESRELAAEHIASGYEKPYEAVMVKRDGSRLPVELLGKTMEYRGRSLRVTAVRDIRTRKRREETIRQQADEILEISTPILQVREGVIVAPLIGTLDSERSQRLAEELLTAVVETGSEVVLIDITGVPTIDTMTAQHLIETISAVRLLGARVVLTGVRAAIAQSLVHLGIDLSDIVTRSSLAAGLRVALEMMGGGV